MGPGGPLGPEAPGGPGGNQNWRQFKGDLGGRSLNSKDMHFLSCSAESLSENPSSNTGVTGHPHPDRIHPHTLGEMSELWEETNGENRQEGCQ